MGVHPAGSAKLDRISVQNLLSYPVLDMTFWSPKVYRWGFLIDGRNKEKSTFIVVPLRAIKTNLFEFVTSVRYDYLINLQLSKVIASSPLQLAENLHM